jgi:aquaporin Z
MGLAIGVTAVGIIYSPWGQQSGAHLNPAVTRTFWRLGNVASADALFYIIAQFCGGTAGVFVAAAVLGSAFAIPPVHHLTTVPGSAGVMTAFLAETVISFFLMLMVLVTTNTARFARYTGIFAGILLVI